MKILIAVVAAFLLSILSEPISDFRTSAAIEFKLIQSALLISCFVYLHYMLHVYIHPFAAYPKHKRIELNKITNDYYSKSFFRGIVGFGYVVLLMSVMPLFRPEASIDSYNYVLLAALLVIMGTVSKARGLLLFLLNERNLASADKNVIKPDVQ
ncbi:MAG: hypothetical protein MI754_10745 [Chromatiales bacterium]|nr:hypothetical protein [Chromatiales bacterium]